MSLAAGTRLGAYEIVSAIGAGGMGEVYRARDTKLDRDVALKILPEFFATDPDRLMRFEREARTLASLNHPHIAQIYGTLELPPEGGRDAHALRTAALIMELVEGEDLAERIARGAVPLEDALAIAKQVAEALEAAHEAGIIHRDLKPANIKVRGDGVIKVLDFGLAKGTTPSTSAVSRPSESPTFTSPAFTSAGVIIGTAAYMAPEQAKGKAVDRRADVWAFGAILFEMLTGRNPFAGESISEILASVIKDEVRWNDLPKDLPPSVYRVLRRCLEKDPARRLSSMADARLDIEDAGTPVAEAVTSRRPAPWLMLVTAALGGMALASAGMYLARPSEAPAAPVLRAVLPLRDLAASRLVGKDDTTITVSPDGRLLAYVNEEHSAIMLHDLETGESREIVRAGEVGAPIFSPDGRFLAYVAGVGGSIRTAVWGSLKKVPVTGGAATNLADDIAGLKGANWGDDGWIYYCPSPSSGLWRVRADGGGAEMLTRPDTASGEKTHRVPFVLPGGRAVLFVVGSSRITSFDDARIEVLRLDDRSRHRLVEGGTSPQYLPTGHLVYQRGGQLLAMPFDIERLEVSGIPVAVAEGVDYFPPAGTSYHTVSANGTLFYAQRNAAAASGSVVALDARGQSSKLADAPFNASSGTISPDGRRLALDPDGATQQIAVIDLMRKTLQRITFEWDNATPIWTSDGARLIFRSNAGGGVRRLHWLAADGSGTAEALSAGPRDEIPSSVHGDLLLYEDVDAKSRTDIWLMSLHERKPHPFVKTPFDEGGAQFSPDGRWVAYQSNQSGNWEIYIQSTTGESGRVQASQGGGVRVLWQPDGKSITYLKGLDVMRVSLAGVSALELGLPVRLFSLAADDLLLDVMRDGRLAVVRREERPPASALTVIVNWFDQVRNKTRQ